MSITEQLNKLIVQFGLDQEDPHFQKYLTALELIKKFCCDYSNENGLVIVGGSEDDIRYSKVHFDSIEKIQFRLVDVNQLAEQSFSEGVLAVLVSHDFNPEIACRLAALGIKYIDLYDYFAENGLFMDRAYYKVFSYPRWNPATFKQTEQYIFLDLKRMVFYQLKKYRSTGSRVVKQTLLRKIVFAFLWMKDFISAEKYIAEYISAGYEGHERYSDFWSELKKLLADVKRRLSERRSKDTLIFCLDAIGYNVQDDLPFLKSIQDTCIVFENMFTVTPFTVPTFKTIFCRKNAVDDRSYELPFIDGANSPFLEYLETNKYKFLYFGPVYGHFAPKYQSRLNKGWDEAGSYIFWSALEQLLLSEQPAVFLIHEKSESHLPYRCADFDGERFITEADMEAPQEDQDLQMRAAYCWLNQQLEFYMDLLPQKSTKIFMSDHGRGGVGRCHTVFQVQGQSISPYREHGLYSYIDLSEIFRCLLEERPEDIQKYRRPYVKIQDVDFYNPYVLSQRIKTHNIGSLASYHGIITLDSQYIRDRMGNESLHLFHSVNRERGEELINFSRKMCGSDYIDLDKDEKFEYSRYLYKVYDRYFARAGAFEEIKRKTISALIPPDDQNVWALRSGNESAIRLLLRLSPPQRSKIHYVIDTNPDCPAGKLGYQVLSLDEVKNYSIDKILLHSFEWRTFFKAEQLATDAEIIDLYDCFEQNGAFCSSDFFSYQLIDSDFDVDFPVKL